MLKFLKKKSNVKRNYFTSLVIVAAGSSSRMGGENKLLMEVFGMPLIAKTLLAFEENTRINEIILVCRECDIVEFSNIISKYDITKPIKLVIGGKTRTESTQNGLKHTNENANFIGIHDGARPLILNETIDKLLDEVVTKNAVIPVAPVKDTIKIVHDNMCTGELDRETLYAVQTPQFFSADIIKEATLNAINENLEFTDDSSCVKSIGIDVYTVISTYDNIKITTKEDVSIANALFERRLFQ